MIRDVPQRLNLLLQHAEDLNEEEIPKAIEFIKFLWEARFNGQGTLWQKMPILKEKSE